MSKKYKLNREKFIDWMLSDEDDRLTYTKDMLWDLKASGEFILTATELLDIVGYIPGNLLDPPLGCEKEVDPNDCELIYKQPFE